MTAERCERCGAAFDCGAGTGACWCGAVELDDAVRARLAARYERCLCPACLSASPPPPADPRVVRAGGTARGR